MKTFFELETRTLVLFVTLILSTQIPAYYHIGEGTTGLLLYVFLLLLVIIALIAGPVVGLFSSLLFIFLIGSFLLYLALPGTANSFEMITISLPMLLGYGFLLIILVVIAGQIHDRIVDQGKLTRKLQNEVKQFVAIDVETGFDNKYRMAIEIESEMRRIDRYDGAFTLILIKLDYFEEFIRLYGDKEQKHLLYSLAQAMQKTIRSTDRKFRYTQDCFALLLTNTDGESIEIVYDKLAETIKTHQLLNQQYVTLSFHTGHVVYEKGVTVQDYQALFSQVESEMVTREL